MKSVSDRRRIRFVIITGAILFVLSAFFLIQSEFKVYRLFRAGICLTFLFFLLKFSRMPISKTLIFFISFYGASSLMSIWYEYEVAAVLTLVLNTLAYISLIIALLPKTSFKMNLAFKIIFILLVLVNGYLLYLLIEMIRDFGQGNTTYALMLISTFTGVILGFLALLYNHTFGSKASIVFCVFVFGIIFAEVFRAIGYYDFGYGDAAVYLARILLIVSLGYLVYFSMLPKELDEQLP